MPPTMALFYPCSKYAGIKSSRPWGWADLMFIESVHSEPDLAKPILTVRLISCPSKSTFTSRASCWFSCSHDGVPLLLLEPSVGKCSMEFFPPEKVRCLCYSPPLHFSWRSSILEQPSHGRFQMVKQKLSALGLPHPMTYPCGGRCRLDQNILLLKPQSPFMGMCLRCRPGTWFSQ